MCPGHPVVATSPARPPTAVWRAGQIGDMRGMLWIDATCYGLTPQLDLNGGFMD